MDITTLAGQDLLIVGGGSGIARALAADAVAPLDHVVSLAAAPANGPVGELDRDAVHTAFDAKVIGPLLLAKHLAPLVRGSFLLFSGVAAWRPAPDGR